jgi:hypothetical protein
MAKVKPTDKQLRALEIFKDVIKDSSTRDEYAKAKDHKEREDIFDKKKHGRDATYDDIPQDARDYLSRLTDDQLAFFSELDEKFVQAGLFVEQSPGYLMIH